MKESIIDDNKSLGCCLIGTIYILYSPRETHKVLPMEIYKRCDSRTFQTSANLPDV